MARFQVYVAASERDWILSKPEGYVRKLIQNDMAGRIAMREQTVSLPKSIKSIEVIEEINKVLPHGGGKGAGNTCKKCGSLLPYYGAKCKRGCK